MIDEAFDKQMRATCPPISGRDMGRMSADARHATAALVRSMMLEISQTRRYVRDLDLFWGEYHDVAAVTDGDLATFAWERFSDAVSRLTRLTYEWERVEDDAAVAR